MESGASTEADRRFEEALGSSGTRDPRDYFRQRLRALKSRDPDGFARAVAYYEEHVVAAIASGEAKPIRTWREYGRFLAELGGAGRTVQIDRGGRASEYDPGAPGDALILFLPDDRRGETSIVGLPADLAPPQRATYELLCPRDR